jgi:hypothetical protein
MEKVLTHGSVRSIEYGNMMTVSFLFLLFIF